MTTPIIAKYIMSVGHTLTTAGAISGLISIASLAVRPISGVLTDRAPKKPLIILALFCVAAATLLYGFVSSAAALAALRLLHGVMYAIAGTALTAYACEFIPSSRMGEGIGYLGFSNTISQAIGPALCVGMSNAFGYRYAFALGSVCIMLGALALSAIKPAEKKEVPEQTDGGQPFKLRLSDLIAVPLIPLTVFYGVFALSNSVVSNYLVMFSETRGVQNTSMYFTILAVVMVFSRPLAGRLHDKKGLRYVIIPATLCAIAGLLLIAGVHSFAMLAAAAVFMAFGQGCGQPAIQAECVRRLGETHRGVALSTYFIFADLSMWLGTSFGGGISERFGFSAMYLCCAGLLAVGLAAFVVLHRSFRAAAEKGHG